MTYTGSLDHMFNLSAAREAANRKIPCEFCGRGFTTGNIKKHTASCYLNPAVMRLCEVCSEPIKNYKEAVTCSYACANKKWPKWPEERMNYVSLCFRYHDKKCIVCDESNIVEVHHLDENRDNNDPSNLMPLCPTHHQYWHSKFRHLIEDQVLEYRDEWVAKRGDPGGI